MEEKSNIGNNVNTVADQIFGLTDELAALALARGQITEAEFREIIAPDPDALITALRVIIATQRKEIDQLECDLRAAMVEIQRLTDRLAAL